MRREAFTRLVDPWAAPDMMFVGYQHEVDIYRQRLAARQRLIDRLRPDERVLAKLPRLASAPCPRHLGQRAILPHRSRRRRPTPWRFRPDRLAVRRRLAAATSAGRRDSVVSRAARGCR